MYGNRYLLINIQVTFKLNQKIHFENNSENHETHKVADLKILMPY